MEEKQYKYKVILSFDLEKAIPEEFEEGMNNRFQRWNWKVEKITESGGSLG